MGLKWGFLEENSILLGGLSKLLMFGLLAVGCLEGHRSYFITEAGLAGGFEFGVYVGGCFGDESLVCEGFGVGELNRLVLNSIN